MFGSRPGPLRRLSHMLFGLALLGTLWVTSLANLSSRPTATALLTDLGAQVLNPYLVTHAGGIFGIDQTKYAALEQVAQAQPNQPLPLPGLKVTVLGRELVGQPYASGVRIIYGHVAEAYYDGGAGAVFAVPQQLSQVIGTFGVFALPSSTSNPGSSTSGSSTQPGGTQSAPTSLPQIPSFLQPFFFALGLSPQTLTATGHAQIASVLLWWWLAVIVFGLLAVILNGGSLQTRQQRGRSAAVQRAMSSLGGLGRPVEVAFDALTGGARRISSVGWATFSGALPGVVLIAIAWIVTFYVYPQQLHPFAAALVTVAGAFFPVYAGGAVLGLIIAAAPWLLLGLILLLGLLAGALLIFRPQPRPAPAQPYAPSSQEPSAGYNRYSPPPGYGPQTGYPGYTGPMESSAPTGYSGYGAPSGGVHYPPSTPNNPAGWGEPGASDAPTMPDTRYYPPQPNRQGDSREQAPTPAYAPRYPRQYPPNSPPNYPSPGAPPYRGAD